MTNILTHHHLAAEALHDKKGDAIMLTQDADGFNEPNTVLLHPWQLRAVCEQFGIIASDPHAAKTIAILQRRLHILRDRIDELGHYMTNFSDHKHADLAHELGLVRNLADLADVFVEELGGNVVAPDPGQPPQAVSPTDGGPSTQSRIETATKQQHSLI